MVDGTIKARTPFATSPATQAPARAVEVLSELTELALELARALQAKALAAVQADDLGRAGKAEAGFNRTALGIRRAIALDAKLREQREEARHKADAHRHRLQDRKNDRRRAIAQAVSRAIAAVKPAVQEQRTADLWVRLTETDRIDADLADTALPIETLILRLGREIGLSDRAIACGLDPAAAKARADRAAAAPKPWDEIPGQAAVPPRPPPRRYDYTPGIYRTIPAADLGLAGTEIYNLNTTTGEIFAPGGKLFRKLPMDDRPPDPAGTAGPPPQTAPPDPAPDRPLPSDRRQWTDADLAEHRRRVSEHGAQWRHWQLFQRIHQQG